LVQISNHIGDRRMAASHAAQKAIQMRREKGCPMAMWLSGTRQP
jgi:hypothetical protein